MVNSRSTFPGHFFGEVFFCSSDAFFFRRTMKYMAGGMG